MTEEFLTSPARPDRRRQAAAVGLVLAVAGGAWITVDRVGPASSAEAVATEAGVRRDQARRSVEPRPVIHSPRLGRLPSRVVVPALGISAPVVAISTDGASLVPPDDPRSLGWWRDGARPGADRGSALLTGHTVHDGGGALDDLDRVRIGQDIVVHTDHGALDYVVRSVRVLDKDVVARRAAALFSQDVDGRLVLVTCEDWDGEAYLSNVVVIAELA